MVQTLKQDNRTYQYTSTPFIVVITGRYLQKLRPEHRKLQITGTVRGNWVYYCDFSQIRCGQNLSLPRRVGHQAGKNNNSKWLAPIFSGATSPTLLTTWYIRNSEAVLLLFAN